MNKTSNGFTLIELMIVIAIIGILASLAVAAYQTYAVRAQVAEGVNMAGSFKTPIVEAYNTTGTPPMDRAATGTTPLATDTQGKYVASVNVVNGRVDVLFGNDAHQDISGQTLSVTPYQSGLGSVVWRCGTAPVQAGTTAMTGGGVTSVHLPPTVDERYLPGTCRP